MAPIERVGKSPFSIRNANEDFKLIVMWVAIFFLKGIPRHPMPFVAKNLFYDERWKEKQQRGLTWWLNFVLTPDDFTVKTNTSPGKTGL